MNRFLSLIVFVFIITISCTTKVDRSIDSDLLLTLKRFQKVVESNPDKPEVKNGGWIVQSNFKYLFNFMDQAEKEQICQLFKNNKIVRIEIRSTNCILFKIRPNYENKFTLFAWEELYLVYNNNCDCVCHTKIDGFEIPHGNIVKLNNNWYKIIAESKMYIGG